ncbi:MAG: hypothetical protein ACE5E8_00810, partial [Acidimicrobiia bacterium]
MVVNVAAHGEPLFVMQHLIVNMIFGRGGQTGPQDRDLAAHTRAAAAAWTGPGFHRPDRVYAAKVGCVDDGACHIGGRYIGQTSAAGIKLGDYLRNGGVSIAT